MKTRILYSAVSVLIMLGLSCAYFNTYYNARKSYEEALELARRNPDDPSSMEEGLLNDAISGAAKVLSVYPDSRWVDDAQLLLGDALLQSGRRSITGSGTSDLEEAMMAYASVLVMTEDRELMDRANMGLGLAAVELERYNDAAASFQSVSREDDALYLRSRLRLIETFLLARDPGRALQVVDTLETPDSDSLEGELILLKSRAYIEEGMADSSAAMALTAGEIFGRGEGYYRALTTAAEAYLQMESPRMAVEVLDRLLAGYRSDLETAEISLLNGKARELSGDQTGALLAYRSAADLDRYREFGAEALYLRALLQEDRGSTDDALATLEELSGRGGGYLWIRLAADRLKDLQLLKEYTGKLEDEDEDIWLYSVIVAEKRIDLYGREDDEAEELLRQTALQAPDMERSLALASLADLLPVNEDSSRAMLMEAYSLSDSGDIATVIEDRMGLPAGPAYENRPSVVLEEAWRLIGEMEFTAAWERLDDLLRSRWSRMMEPEILWAAYVAGEGARIDDSILEDYLTQLSEDYENTRYGAMARNRLGGIERPE